MEDIIYITLFWLVVYLTIFSLKNKNHDKFKKLQKKIAKFYSF